MLDILWHVFALCLFITVTQGLDIYEATFILNFVLSSVSLLLPLQLF